MASSRSSVIQFNDDADDTHSELQFQDFTLGQSSPGVATMAPSGSYSNFSDNADSTAAENEDLLGSEPKEGVAFWKFSYYQSFFDIDTDQVMGRMLYSMVPLPGRATFLDRMIRPKPDMYGPFWICTTLVFSMAIGANISNYLMTEGASAKSWTYDFHKVSLAATAIYSYVFLLPVILWGLMWYRQSSNRYTLLEILCVYGYSLAIYVPISVLWVIQVAWFQWVLVIVGAALSGAVLLQTFWPIFKDDNKKLAAIVLCLMFLFHTLLAVGFVTYFFHPSNEHSLKVATGSPTVVTAVTEKSMSKLTRSIENTEAHYVQKDSVIQNGSQSLQSLNLVKANYPVNDAMKESTLHFTEDHVSRNLTLDKNVRKV
ncbi:protein YIPF1-like [Uloborus diversus]|uniref:protein YIPF1-like n=1 Tax=Uloborus diversus TaxID=327109 RepID=UPI00240A5624|nr:protein YIPF1-like [Uloborus diversus]